MLAPPIDLDISELTAELADGWGVVDPTLDYLEVGFGSHHWRVTAGDQRRWFVTVDEHREAGTLADLRRAFTTASALRRDAGLPFVLAPIPDTRGDVIRVLGGGAFTVAVTPWIDASPLGPGPYTSTEDRELVLRLLGQLHTATPRIGTLTPPPIDLALPDRAGLRSALADLDASWQSGVYGELARALLRSDRPRLVQALDRYDELVKRVAAESASWVVTHGEPHTANVLCGADNVLYVIDWDTARLAPREHDLWMVIEPGTDLAPYREEVGDVPISAAAMRLFRMRWDLGEIALYVTQFHALHADDPNTREAWTNLGEYLPVSGDHLAAVSG